MLLKRSFDLCQLAHAGDNKPKEAAQDAASTMKSALPDEPKQAAKDAASAVKDNLPEAPSNPFQSFFSGKYTSSMSLTYRMRQVSSLSGVGQCKEIQSTKYTAELLQSMVLNFTGIIFPCSNMHLHRCCQYR